MKHKTVPEKRYENLLRLESLTSIKQNKKKTSIQAVANSTHT